MRLFRTIRPFLERIASPLAALAIWELVARSGAVEPYLLPSASVVFARIGTELVSGTMLREAGWTLYRVAVGFAIASILGAAIGVLMSRVRAVRWFVDPLISIGFPIPKISFLPIFMLWFGMFDLTKIVMTVVACVFPVITATWAGTQGVDRHLVWSAQNFGAKPHALLWEVILPAALPQVFTGLQVALPIAFIVVTVTEMLTGGSGLGGAMITGARYADSPRVFANLIAVGTLGFVAMRSLEWVRRRLLVWHEEVQRGQLGA